MSAPNRDLDHLMRYEKPKFSASEINAAGKYITTFDPNDYVEKDLAHALEVLTHFKVCHHFPLDSLYTTLRKRALKVHGNALTAQRIKRSASIVRKLVWQPSIKLGQMQDIGGCRAVMPNLQDVFDLHDLYMNKTQTHFLVGENDYIKNPKDTGYRSVHLKYRFSGKGNSVAWDKLRIEIQIRTLRQHRWATAVEVAGTFTNTALKSNRGHGAWLRFFTLMASVYALREGCAVVPSTPSDTNELFKEIRDLNDSHHIVNTFSDFRTLIPHLEQGKASGNKYFLITLDPTGMQLQVRGFKKDELKKADDAYRQAERAQLEAEKAEPTKSATQVVLVRTTNLQRAYPNYFLDSADFLRDVVGITGRTGRRTAA